MNKKDNSAILEVKLTSPRVTWEELNEEEGFNPILLVNYLRKTCLTITQYQCVTIKKSRGRL